MKAARIVILGVAVIAAGGAGFMALKLMNREPEKQIIVQKETPIQAAKVLVAANDISIGTKVAEDMIRWQDWPKDGLAENLIIQKDRPDAIEKIVGQIARSMIFSSEPIRETKLVNSDSGFMSAILPKGQRAVATNISTSTSAGGFILPNDKVDILMTRKRSGRNEKGFTTEVILENIRILAIDQIIEEKDGGSFVVGETATLQLNPRQVEILAVAQETADRLSLSLRSIADSGDDASENADYLLGGSRGTVRVIRYGNLAETDAPVSARKNNQRTAE